MSYETMTLPYGKYRGWTPHEVIQQDRQYLTWFVRNCRADPTLLSTIGRLLHQKQPPMLDADAFSKDGTTQNPSDMAKRANGQQNAGNGNRAEDGGDS
ncbi:MAG: hypothetical protein IT446_05675 [Phycisphaerales bacterium]|nr:hypothetical protein [Phycisphaerales bacterium]